MTDTFDLSCPTPVSGYDRVVLAHGAGGRLMQRLISDVFVAAFDDPELRRGHDGASLDLHGPIAVTTDTFTVAPMFFPGGDIGSLAVHGTVNDVAMCGARPRYLTAAFVLEEGLPMEELRRVVASMANAARACGVRIVTGDTKVVERGNGDGIFITTTGFGERISETPIDPSAVRGADAILVSGPLGDHGIAVLTARQGMEIDSPLRSDAGPVVEPCLALLQAGIDVHCLRDPTRGGLASVLNEITQGSGLSITLDETAIPVRPEVADACELLGLDPLYVASEGQFVAFVSSQDEAKALQILRAHGCQAAATIGHVGSDPQPYVTIRTATGGQRILDMLAGDQLPRIC